MESLEETTKSERFAAKPLFIYVDVDETLVHKTSEGEEEPNPAVVRHIEDLASRGCRLYCWSTGGEHHARKVAEKLGIGACFQGFLHKPQVFIDDQHTEEWEHFVHVWPDKLGSLEEYREKVEDKDG